MLRRILAPLVTLWLLTSAPLSAQGYPPSQRGSVSQRVAFTDISIAYGRPTARGRALFGALVPWDSIWHPGADLATQITVSRDITLEGTPVAKGTYTVWLIPRATGAWTFILNRKKNIQHTPYPGAAYDALRLEVMPDQASSVESLTYQFPMVLRDEATLRLQWGTTGVAMKIKAPYRPE
ncbi:DUF2911 domain-containing protein [Gemmatimonas groenlandica]|uniref:DUF2911 domain-containing protein n=1 Tax=Gemmatimonas groenlandica TaxID=2732249 RepID=A0A6M4IPZ9_9BACT|nr:DUF2911 domain-containing protein [Gemmatimonas groenlandica]QJR35819.1 DUF2911 domain-containing protein [Gemmatimonas groenlandica]